MSLDSIDFKPTTTDAFGPKCPNHGCPLITAAGSKTAGKGRAPCQESNVMFDYEVDATETRAVKGKDGAITHVPVYNVEPKEDA